MKILTRVLTPVAALALAAGLAACGGSDKGATSSPAPTTVNTAAPLYAQLPQAVKDKGSVQVGSDIAYAPMEYYDTDGSTVVGFDKELGDLLGTKLGVPLVFNNATFDGLITQLDSNRFDAAISSMSDTKERQQKVDFVDYYMSGSIMFVKAGNPEHLATVDDLCGRTISLQRGTVQEEFVTGTLGPRCVKAGKKAPTVMAFDRESEAMLQIEQGRAVAGIQEYPVAVYNTRQSNGKFQTVGEQVIAGPLGIAVSKQDTQLRDALQKALQQSIDDGSYQKLIDKYQTPQSAVKEATINAGT
ncbi:amino acid ABC transporter substrate-binding protein, PAAT family [Raineyella antarctica]|uniref:Amino acid ABC transporter substrate-binding protein, PAAT family n=1 Tax=Raineyella antarctica TaxID=1577474 RepID=A0A1G6H4B9_9ACTN|nr:ABC transporter substrate-binding protein [Raineyella antarctica]SDB88276.1 amino acid ABC transporter substrate-binding protein, PAAT family [Raineyella antarctica]